MDRDLNEWQQTLTDEDRKRLTCNGTFPLPHLPSYSKMVEIKPGAYYGALGYGNGTEHTILVVLDQYSHGGCVHIGVKERGFYNFDLQEAQSSGVAWPYIVEKLKILEWEAHLLSVHLRTLLRRVGSGQSPYWERPAKYRHEFE